MNYFSASFNLNQEDSTQIYIKRCKKFIAENNNNNSQQTKNDHNQSFNNEENSRHKSNSTTHTKERSKSTPVESEQDRECLKIIKKKDYYDILEIPKTADENEIKKAYKKVKEINFYNYILN